MPRSVLWGAVLESEPGRRSAVLTRLSGPIPHNLGVDRAGDAVVQLGIQLGQLVAGVDAGLRDVTDSGSLHNIPDHELTDGLVLGTALSTAGTADVLDVSPAVLVTAMIPPLGGHLLS